MIRLLTRCLLGIGVWLYSPNVSAQDASSPPLSTPQVERKGDPVLRQAPLDAVILLDANNKRVFLPGNWPLTVLDDFRDFLFKNPDSHVPPFIIRNVSAIGTVVGNYVEAQVRIELKTTTYRPVHIPLGFKEGILPSDEHTFQYTGTGFAELTSDTNEYIAIVFPSVVAGIGRIGQSAYRAVRKTGN